MPSKLTNAQKAHQVVSFTKLLKASGKTTITRDQIHQLYNDTFKANWTQEMPGERCVSLSDLRYRLTIDKVLRKTAKSSDDYIVSHRRSRSRKSPAENGGEKEKIPKSSSPSRSRRKMNMMARLAVDQHITIHKKGPEKSKQSKKSKPDSTTQRDSPQPDANQPDTPEAAHSLKTCAKGFVCSLCKVTVKSEQEAVKHTNGKKHRVQTMLFCLKRDKDILVQNKHDVSVSSAHLEPDGTIRVVIEEGVMYTIGITVKNHSATQSIIFRRCELLKRVRVFKLDDAKGVTDGLNTVCLGPSECYVVVLSIKASHIGAFQTAIVFAFTRAGPGDTSVAPQSLPPSEIDKSEFLVLRYLCVRCTDPLTKELQPKVKYTPPPRVSAKLIDVEVVEGFPLPRNKNEFLEKDIKLKIYYVQPELRTMVNHGMEVYKKNAKADIAKKELERGLTVKNHASRFETLLQIEEIQMEVDIRKYDMVGVTMERSTRLLILKVPGLAENRPSILKGDHLFVRILGSSGKPEGCEYQGFVHDVGPDKVYLGFSSRLLDRYIKDMKFSIRYAFNRLPLRTNHRAVELAAENSLDKTLFPTETTALSMGVCPAGNIRYFDQRVQANDEQKEAVRHIVEGSSRPAPYLIFGPPGTGKTVTIVEAIKQVVTRNKSCHALVCAPSNSASDLITERLLASLDKSTICRLHAASRNWNMVPDKIKSCSNYDVANREFCYPNKEKLCRFRVIVCTLVTASRLVSANFPAGHFTHVFVDEAGNAVEPEALIPIAGILDCDLDPAANHNFSFAGQVVLAGDPKQLGPVIRSPIASQYGLGMSLLERLMTSCDVYQRRPPADNDASVLQPYNPLVLTKLVRNYRSHPAILHLPNHFFYDNELEMHADVALRESLCRWEELPVKGFPIIFHGTTAHERREERSPSFFNPTEVSVVVKYVKELLTARKLGIKLTPKDIGIMSPYRKQVQKIQQALKIKKLPSDIKVGSVEEFQGQERHVLIISTVRTSPEYLSMDMEYKLGFLKNPKRFNVAMTRAKALLIVVGNPYILAQDEHWNAFLEYCQEKGAYTGVDYEPESDRLEDIIQRFSSFNMDETGSSVSMKELIKEEEPGWRRSDD